MSKNTISFGGSDEAALQYIRERGYASYSSLVNVKECRVPTKMSATYFDVGTEVHSIFLEGKKSGVKLSADNKKAVDGMVKSLQSHPVVSKLMDGATTEVKFHQPLYGLPVLGYIDILPAAKDVADLKTTRHRNLHQFAKDMNFLQAALYMAVTKRKSFYYIGIQKEPPYSTLIFNVNRYPERIRDAQIELRQLILYVKSKL